MKLIWKIQDVKFRNSWNKFTIEWEYPALFCHNTLNNNINNPRLVPHLKTDMVAECSNAFLLNSRTLEPLHMVSEVLLPPGILPPVAAIILHDSCDGGGGGGVALPARDCWGAAGGLKPPPSPDCDDVPKITVNLKFLDQPKILKHRIADIP